MTPQKNIDFGLFENRKVFVTGHTGFKGSWLTKILSMAGAEVLGYSLDDLAEPNHYDLLKMNDAITSISGDIRNFEHLSEVVAEFQPEFIFHLAAQPIVRESYKRPLDTFSTNFMGTVNMLEAIKFCDELRSFVYVSTDKCYENKEYIWGYREIDQLGGADPYSASKGASEIAVLSYVNSFFQSTPWKGVASARAGNVIGGGDWGLDRLVPDCVRAIENDSTIKIRNGESIRPWQHVLEPLAGYLLLAEELFKEPTKYGGAWNFGPSNLDSCSVMELAQRLVKKFGKGNISVDGIEKSQMKETTILQLNCDKAIQTLGWRPRWNINQTIDRTAYWYGEYLAGKNIRKITENQIQEYFTEI